MANLKEIDALRRKLKDIEAIEKKPAKSVTSADRQKMDSKPQVESDIRALERRSRMWFESEFEFAPRLSKALEELAVNEAEIRRKEEEEAWQRKLREEEEEIERKRKEAQDKQEEQEKKVTQQLEARRLEAAAKPQKAAAQPKKKEKKAVVKLDPKDLFVLPPQGAAAHEAEEAEMVLADVHVEGDEDMTDPPVPEEPPKPAAPEPAPAPAPKPKPTPAPTAVEKPKPKPKPAKVVIESKWDAPTPVPAPAAEGEEDASENPSLLASSGPSLADAAKPAKKVPAPQPKKKEKKKFTKLSNNDLGFDCDNPNYKGAN